MPMGTSHLPKTQLTSAGEKRLLGEQYMDLKSLSLAEHTCII